MQFSQMEPSLKNLTNNYGVPRKEANPILETLGAPHISSFNFLLNKGLKDIVNTINPVQFELPNEDRVSFYFLDLDIAPPSVPAGSVGCKDHRIFPTECRQKLGTYGGVLTAKIGWSINGINQEPFERNLGTIPIMVKSDICNIAKMNPGELIAHNEHPDEWGGYFIVRGLQKIIRMLIMARRNYPLCVRRNLWKDRGPFFSEIGVQIRCAKDDQTLTNNILHFLTNGTVKIMFSNRKILYYAPLCLILKSLVNKSDMVIFKALLQGFENDTYYAGCVQNMLRNLHETGLHSQKECKEYVGKMFRAKFFELPPWSSDIEVADFILNSCIMIHLDSNEDKFNTLVFMCQKLFSYAQEHCTEENVDSLMMHELLLGGHLYLQIIKEKLGAWLYGLRSEVLKRKSSVSLTQSDVTNAVKYAGGIQAALENFLATGNLSSHTGLGLMQEKGLVIIAENINRQRYMSHFRAIHRGSFFVQMRTTESRQFLPEAWGFVCPVHTPDGAPCGLLNHLTMNCQVTDVPDYTKRNNIISVLINLGMLSVSAIVKPSLQDCYITLLDGKVLGYITIKDSEQIVSKLRIYKIEGKEIPNTTEIVLIKKKSVIGQFPGLYLFTGPARLVRPCIHLSSGKIELIGTFEQVYLDICVKPEEIYKGLTTHMEISKTAFLSNLAKLIPMPDCNQSPRNMYQCQMGKQTMGTPIHTWHVNADTKLYRLEMPTSPLFRPAHHDEIDLDDYSQGVNAIVAVISYTGYDMEDAIVINKSSYERGLAHGCIYKTEKIELRDVDSFFGRDPSNQDLNLFLDIDGFPNTGTYLKNGNPFYSYFDANANKFVVKLVTESEDIIIDNVRLCGNFTLNSPRKAIIVYRIPRNPSVGDKFASRAGQKGICSQLWPSEDLPFSETGLIPDIIFNPHGFPSRMTIAMMIEIMAGKSAALHGVVHDATPFRFDENDTAIDYFGRLLEIGGYNYYGTEAMYSGIDGRELTAHIFMGVVHYQRLRHMVSDKWQVRRTGPTDQLTHQPIKGRKRGGGIRFGEMERDALISHGASFLLQDRLLNCSDKSSQMICKTCGTLVGPLLLTIPRTGRPDLSDVRPVCRLCGDNADVGLIEIPYIFKYLVQELASLDISIKLKLSEV